ncbi:MAG: aminotransferase class III-fold pyridoxal phosphate-dependent enzyme [Anaerovoracaceae bacterium]|jgi:adenosylmethionine-8-amino-7-oxononanoate aminotransferase
MKSKFISPVSTEKFTLAHRGSGIYIYDDTGKKYLDGSSGAMTVNLGHNNPEIANAIKEQLDRLTFTYRSQFTNQPLEELCNEIASLAPGDLIYVSLANSGSEATELAMKMAYSYWVAKKQPMKQRVISRWSSYHGSTMGSLSMSGNAARRKEYAPYVSDFPVLELPFCHLCPYEKEPHDCNLFCANYLQKMINRFGSENVSAVICEPITGASGAGITPPDGYFERIQQICRDNSILFILDEVITGFGRTGKYFAAEHWDLQPDIIVFGKGISSGYVPLSGIIVRQHIYEEMAQGGMNFSTGHTFSGNPLAAANALAVINYLKKHDIVKQVEEKGLILEKALKEVMRRSRMVSDIRGKGLLWGVEFSKDKTGRNIFDPKDKITERVVKACFSNGLIVYPSSGYIDGIHGDSVLISPPLIISEEEIHLVVELLDASIRSVEKDVLGI